MMQCRKRMEGLVQEVLAQHQQQEGGAQDEPPPPTKAASSSTNFEDVAQRLISMDVRPARPSKGKKKKRN